MSTESSTGALSLGARSSSVSCAVLRRDTMCVMARSHTVPVRMNDEELRMLDEVRAYLQGQQEASGLGGLGPVDRSSALRLVLRAAHREFVPKAQGQEGGASDAR